MRGLYNESLSVMGSFEDIVYVVNNHGEKIAGVFPQRDLEEEAIAHLLAAAPDMYTLLRDMVEIFEEYDAEDFSDPFEAKEFFEILAKEFLVDAHEILSSAEGKTE